jgi:hypothetical protein
MESRVWTFVIIVLVSRSLAFAAVVLWIYSRYTIAQYHGADD